NKDTDKIALARISADCQIENFGVIGKWTAPHNIERLGLLGQHDSAIPEGEGVGGVASRLAMTARFIFRILSSLLEEVGESCIEITQGLLKNNRTDLGKKGFLRLLFPLCQFRRSHMIANGFLLLLPGLVAIFQSLIVNEAGAAEGFRQLSDLHIGG